MKYLLVNQFGEQHTIFDIIIIPSFLETVDVHKQPLFRPFYNFLQTNIKENCPTSYRFNKTSLVGNWMAYTKLHLYAKHH